MLQLVAIFLTFLVFYVTYLPSWIRIRIRIVNAEPEQDQGGNIYADPQPCFSDNLSARYNKVKSNSRYPPCPLLRVRNFFFKGGEGPYLIFKYNI